RDDVGAVEGHDGAHVLQQGRDSQDLVRDVGVLAELAVDPGLQAEVREGADLVGGDQVGTDGGEGVEGLARGAIFAAAHGHVEQAGVPGDVGGGVVGGDVAGGSSDDEGELTFLVEAPVVVGQLDRLPGRDHRG